MANKNNNIDSLASEIDGEPTAELEALSDTFVAEAAKAPPRETDEATFSFDESGDLDEVPASRLRSDLRTRDDRISKLQYDIEQLRSRWTGLEREIRAREEQTERLNAELRELEERLAERDKALESLQRQLAAKEGELVDAEADLAAARDDQSTTAARVAVLEMQQSSDAATIRMLEDDLEALRARPAEQPAPTDLEAKLEQSRIALADLTQYVEGRNAAWQARDAELEEKDRLLGEQALRIESLSADLAARSADGAGGERAAAAQPSYYEAEVDELRDQVRRTEAYADSLRQQLADAREDAAADGADQARLRQSLDNALARIADLRRELDEQRLRTADVESQQQAQEGRHAAEQAELRELAERQRRQLDEYRCKVESKNNAITALLNELACKSSAMDSLNEIGHVVHDLDDRMTASIDERDTQDRERSTRLLVGTIEGQKLRFPLFKERLTIGRSADNDIQLKTQCISRKHAVIVSDGRGCRIADRNSRNGIYVNGRRVTEANLVNGDSLVIGTATLVFEERGRR